MMARQIELPALVEMTLKTDAGRFPGIYDGVRRAAGLVVDAARAVTRFTADLLRVASFRFQQRMRRRLEILHNRGVALLATFRAGEFRPRNLRRRDQGVADRRAGNQPHHYRRANHDGQRFEWL